MKVNDFDNAFLSKFRSEGFGSVAMRGPMTEVNQNFYVAFFKDIDTNWWIYYSNGCRDICGKQEFVTVDKNKRSINVELLHWIAFASIAYGAEVGSLFDIGISWAEGRNLSHILISLLYPFDPSIAQVDLEDGERIMMHWALPIYPQEHSFAAINGVEALEQRFDKAGIDFLDYSRPPVA